MSAHRDRLVAAFEQNDHDTIKVLGWWELWDVAHNGWAPRQSCKAREFVPYAKLLGDEKPADVLEAFRALAGEWRPAPGHILGYLNGKRRELHTDVGRGRDRASTPEAIAAHARARAGGEPYCSCPTRPFVCNIDAEGVLRCPRCGGLEIGQGYHAEDMGLAA